MTHAPHNLVITHHLDLSVNDRSEEHPQQLFHATTKEMSVLQTVKRRNSQVVDHCTYRLANCSTRCEKTVPSYFFNIMKKVKSQMEIDRFDPSDPISIVGFLATFNLANDTNRTNGGAAMWVFSFLLRTLLQRR